uniref:AlNc14C226G9221 protein n=1 Tax=Albugo laibachii Nc14 TaxID=890382 RepID=F0WS83_9STRA|nr:AlNc14C226G9221 [Albugo laibachii Nc14]|eukprot:CCA24201.1 AlNc14C226G9221 [Albugo laibachii Nc14]
MEQHINIGHAQQTMLNPTSGENIKNLACTKAKQLSEEIFRNLAYCIGFFTDVYLILSDGENKFILFQNYDRSILASVCKVQVEELNFASIRSAEVQQRLSLVDICLMLGFARDELPTFHTKVAEIADAGGNAESKKRKGYEEMPHSQRKRSTPRLAD